MNDTRKVQLVIQEWQRMMDSPEPVTKWDLAIIGGHAVGLLQRLLDQAQPVTPDEPQRPYTANVGASMSTVNVPSPVRPAPTGPMWDRLTSNQRESGSLV